MIKLPLLLFISLISISNNASEVIKEALRMRVENHLSNTQLVTSEKTYANKTLISFYEENLFTPLWQNKTILSQLNNIIHNAEQEGLNSKDYHLDFLINKTKQFQHLSIQEKVDLELIASDAFLIYLSHLLSGKVNPSTIESEWHVLKREGKPTDLLKKIHSKNLQQIVEESLPKHKTYTGLKKALAYYNEIKIKGIDETILEGETIKVGLEDKRIPLIRERLLLLKFLKKPVSNSILYDDDLYNAVKLFQESMGILSDGNIGKATLSALNVSIEDRINQIKVNLERWRWLPQEFENYYIKVNIANYTLSVHKNGVMERSHKAIVGKSARKTPVFDSKMSYLVFNPTWTVPPGILRADVIPGVKKDRTYLQSKNLTIYDHSGNRIDPNTVDWNTSIAKNYIYRQPPGKENALGAVKFMFPNPFSVYIHDTPSKDLFNKQERAFSSGCIRVQHPLDLAEYLLKDNDSWSREKIEQTIKTNITTSVNINNPPAVYILYWTAWLNEDNVVEFRKDIYSRDLKVLNALNMSPSKIY